MFRILRSRHMKRVQRMVVRTMMMVMTIAMMTVTQTLHLTLVVQMMESMSCRVVHGFGQNMWVFAAGSHRYRSGVGFATRTNTVPVTGYHGFQPPIPTLDVGVCLPYACLHSSMVSDFTLSPAPAVSHHLLPRAVSTSPVPSPTSCHLIAPSRCATSHLRLPPGPSPPLGHLPHAISPCCLEAALTRTASCATSHAISPLGCLACTVSSMLSRDGSLETASRGSPHLRHLLCHLPHHLPPGPSRPCRLSVPSRDSSLEMALSRQPSPTPPPVPLSACSAHVRLAMG